MSAALVTLCLNDRKIWGRSHEVFQAYADRCGMDFLPIQERRIRLNPRPLRPRLGLYLEKLQLGELLDDYERIVYLDADVLIHPQAPSLLQRVPSDRFGCVREDVGPLAWKRREEITTAAAKLGPLQGWDQGYFNAGVMVMSRCHRDVFRCEREAIPRCRWPDQTYLNYRVHALGVDVMWLEPEYNLIPEFGNSFWDAGKRRKAHFIHYAGKEGKPVWEDDLPYYYKLWNLG